MSRFLSFILWTLVALLVSAQGVFAQQDKVEYTPVRIQEYSNLSTFPSACFQNAWLDSTGRLLLLTCPPEAADGIQLFSFDGYEFRVIRGALDSLPTDSKILARTDEYTFAGRAGNEKVFTINILSGEIRTLEIPEGKDNGMISSISPDSLVVAKNTGNSIALITWTPNEVTSTFIECPASLATNTSATWMSQSFLWFFDAEKTKVIRIKLSNLERKEFNFDPESTSMLKNQNLQFRMFLGDTAPYLSIKSGHSHDFFTLNASSDVFSPVLGIPKNLEDCGAFQDKSGNTLIAYKTAGEPYEAIIHPGHQEKETLHINFAELGHARLENIVGNDFTSSFIICHSRGILSVKVTSLNAVQNTLPGQQIRAMIETEQDKVFVTTQKGDNYFIDLQHPDEVDHNNWHCVPSQKNLFQMPNGVFVGINNDGLITFDPFSGKCQTLVSEIGSIHLAGRHEHEIVMVTSNSQVYRYDISQTRVTPVGKGGKALEVNGRLHDITYAHGFWWIASSNGLWKINSETGSLELLGKEPPFTDYHFMSILVAGDDRLWLGTSLGGVQIYNPTDGSVEVLDARNGLPSNTVVSIQEDQDGDYWVATYDGVALVNQTGRLIRVLDQSDGLAGNEANRYASLTTKSGKILIGSTNGLSIIDPVKIKSSIGQKEPPRLYLTDTEYRKKDGNLVLINNFSQLQNLKEVTLPAENRSLKLRFALSSFTSAAQNTYQWKFAGSPIWKTIANDCVLVLEDITAGKHQLILRGFDADGNLSSNEIRLNLRVQRFFFQQWWFYALCGLLIAGLTTAWIMRLRYAVVRATETISKDKRTIEQQAEQLQALSEAKSKYFTEISHEFRTPLTIISGMAAQIMEDPVTWSEKGATLIRNNSQRLLKLVNQILDLRKLESSDIPYRMVQGNIVAYLSYLADTFNVYTQSRSIDFSFIPYEDQIQMDYDPDWIADIVTNLVSNAIKFCEAGDQVRIEVEKTSNGEASFCLIRVVDTGAGIPEEHLPHIFEQFYRAGTSQTKVEGSGVGLALVNELVQKLHGKVWAESTFGEGSTFSVQLPITLTSTVTHDLSDIADDQTYAEPESSLIDDRKESDIHVLVVEDNPDLVEYMQSILSSHYTLHIARDGLTGETMALELTPDIVISDVMMPGQTGIDLCAKIKADRRTDHIPVILLTARVDKETKLESLEKKADAFLTKPFDRQELMMIIANLLEQRHQLQLKYMSDSPMDVPLEESEPVDAFVTALQKEIDARLSDEDFSVVHLCRAMSMSRTNLHNKIKALTGRSTTGYIRYRRLLRARQLLKEGKLNVSEVAYAVGFSSQSYFSTTYAKEFGAPPSEFTS